MLTSKWINKFVLDTRVRTSYDFLGSDHRLLVSCFRVPKKKHNRMQFQKTKPRKIKNISELKIPKSEKVFLDEIDAVCDSINSPVSSQHNWINLVKILNSAAEKAIPEKTEKSDLKLWNDDPVLVELHKKRELVDRNIQTLSLNEYQKKSEKIQSTSKQIL